MQIRLEREALASDNEQQRSLVEEGTPDEEKRRDDYDLAA